MKNTLTNFLSIFLLSTSTLLAQDTPLYQWNGLGTNDGLGFSVSNAGDVNNDGYNDIIVGAPELSPFDEGFVRIYNGKTGSLIRTHTGLGWGDLFGYAVDGAGDVNNDGYDDYVISAPETLFGDPGYVHVYSGRNGARLLAIAGPYGDASFGFTVGGVGDVNGDGRSDIIVSAFTANPGGISAAGSAYLYSGANGTQLHRWDGTQFNEWLGLGVSGAGDVNGDGIPDILISSLRGVSGSANSGVAQIYSGANYSTLIHEFSMPGGTTGNDYGCFVNEAGDVDNDGYDDVIVGAGLADLGGTDTGSAFVYSGATGATLYRFNGSQAGEQFGNEVSGAGDVNGDGYDDLLIGAPDRNGGFGAAELYSGQDGTLLKKWDGQTPGGTLGNAVAGLGDINGDGNSEVILGAPESNGNVGEAFVFSVTFGPTYSINNLVAGQYATFQVTGAQPGVSVLMGYSLTGAGPINTQFGQVSLTPPIKTLVTLNADGNGNAFFTPLVPGAASGFTFYTQAKCGNELSNPLAIPIQ
jgi:hypothetical protein